MHEDHEEIIGREEALAQALVHNDAAAVSRFLTDDWLIVDADGGIIERSRFLQVIQSGALTHNMMESADWNVRRYGDTVLVTALTTTSGSFNEHAFATQERATDVWVQDQGRWLCALSHLTTMTKT